MINSEGFFVSYPLSERTHAESFISAFIANNQILFQTTNVNITLNLQITNK